jgi:hypothetical protein
MGGMRFRVFNLAFCLLIATGWISQSQSQDLLRSRNQVRRDSEIEMLTAGTYLARDVISEHDTAEVIRRVLKKDIYEDLDRSDYLALLEDTVKEYPESRVAHEALADTLIGHEGESSVDFRRGVQELKRASELSFRDGVVRYEPQLPYYLAITGDEEGLHRYAEQAFALIPEGPKRYPVYLYYANALARLKSPLTDEMFKRAIATRPIGQWAPYEFYVTYLRDSRRYERVLELLTPEILKEAAFLRDIFQAARCESLQVLNRSREAKTECRKSKINHNEHLPSVGSTPERGKTDFPHDSNQPDDCRYQSGCLYHPQCPYPGYCVCYNAFVWNLAEIALNEAIAEAPGSQDATAWTLRDRAIR